MDTIDSLIELNDFGKFKSFIRNFIIEDSVLWKLIYYSSKNPLLEDYSDNPYEIFEESSEHGCVLFKRKNNTVLSEETVNILVDFYDTKLGDSYFLNDLYICFRILCKGTNIQELENGVNRTSAIAKRIDDQFNLARVNNIGEIKRLSYKEIPINEQNDGVLLTYNCRNWGTKAGSNVNYKKRWK
jgi:hypothetical protein